MTSDITHVGILPPEPSSTRHPGNYPPPLGLYRLNLENIFCRAGFNI